MTGAVLAAYMWHCYHIRLPVDVGRTVWGTNRDAAHRGRVSFGPDAIRRLVIADRLGLSGGRQKGRNPLQMRIIDLAGRHDHGWVVASEGNAWWQPDTPDLGELVTRGVFAVHLNNI